MSTKTAEGNVLTFFFFFCILHLIAFIHLQFQMQRAALRGGQMLKWVMKGKQIAYRRIKTIPTLAALTGPTADTKTVWWVKLGFWNVKWFCLKYHCSSLERRSVSLMPFCRKTGNWKKSCVQLNTSCYHYHYCFCCDVQNILVLCYT